MSAARLYGGVHGKTSNDSNKQINRRGKVFLQKEWKAQRSNNNSKQRKERENT